MAILCNTSKENLKNRIKCFIFSLPVQKKGRNRVDQSAYRLHCCTPCWGLTPRLSRHNETKVWKAYRVIPQVSRRPSDARLVSNANTDRVSWDSLRNADTPMSPQAGHITFAVAFLLFYTILFPL